MIEQYEFGLMKIDGRTYRDDLKIIEGKVVGNWFRKQGHVLHRRDIEDVLAAKPDILVIGTGHSGRMRIDDDAPALLKERDIELIAEPTAKAYKKFNDLHSKGKNAAAGFHLTC